MTLWSNPTPSNADSAALSAGFHVQAADIGSLVHSILQYREQQQQQQQKAYTDIAKGVAGAYGSYQQGQSANSANDAANAAIYGSQYPNDPYGGYSNPDVVPDYGGTSALAGIGAERKLNPDAFMSAEERALKAAQIDEAQARAHDLWTYPPNSGRADEATNGQQMVANRAEADALRKQMEAELPYSLGQYGKMSYGNFDSQSGNFKEDPNGPYGVVGGLRPYTAPGQAGPWYKGGYGGTPPSQGRYAPPEDVIAAEDARKAQDALHQYQALLQARPGTSAGATTGAAPGVRQESIDQVKQAAPDMPPIAPQQPTTAPGYGNKAVMIKAPDGTVSPVDPDLVDYYKKKGAVVVVQ